MHKILFYNKFISCLYIFRAYVLIIGSSKLHYTASGIIITIGVMIPEANSSFFPQTACTESVPFSKQTATISLNSNSWLLFITKTEPVYWAVDCVWNVMAHAQKPDFVFLRNGRVHLNRWGCQFSRLLAAEVWASAVVMLGTPCSEVVWRVLVTHSIRQFPLHFPSHASPCAIAFQLDSTKIHSV